MMDTALDIKRDMYNEWYAEQKMAMQDNCERCTEHTSNCPFYDSEEEYWDYEECYEVRG